MSATQPDGAPRESSELAHLRLQLGAVLAALAALADGGEGTQPAESSDPPTTTRHTDAATTAGDPLADMPTLIPVSRAAAVLGISRASAYRYAASGDLPTTRLGGRLYVVTARLRALLGAA